MASYQVYFIHTTGLTLSAFPLSASLADWSSLRLACTESVAPNLGRYSVTITDDYAEWVIFEKGVTAPTTFDDGDTGISLSFSESDINIISASGSSAARGGFISLNLFEEEDTEITVTLDDVTLDALEMRMVIEDNERTDLLVISDADIIRDGGEFRVTITTAVTASIGTYSWSLRDITGGVNTVLAHGPLIVSYAAEEDP